MKKKKVLMMATTAAMSEQFNKNNIMILEKLGYEVHVAGNYKKGNPIPDEKIRDFVRWLHKHGAKSYHMPSTRKFYDVINNGRALARTVKLIKQEKYEFIHCHTPIGATLGRLAGRITHTPVIYTAHGLHFFDGAPLQNWVFYPIEKFLSRFTDVMILIKHEDYDRVKKHFHAKKVIFMPGVGIDTEKFYSHRINRDKMRESFGIKDDEFLLVSVGELSYRKNHEVIIKALQKIGRDDIKYLVAGKGKSKDNSEAHLRALISEYNMGDQVKLLGFRSDVFDIYAAADASALPSKREGLCLAGIEAMAAGLPIITSDVNEYSVDKVTGLTYKPDDVEGFASGLEYMMENRDWCAKVGEENVLRAEEYDYHKIDEIMENIYKSMKKASR